jgi:hypothetical protein
MSLKYVCVQASQVLMSDAAHVGLLDHIKKEKSDLATAADNKGHLHTVMSPVWMQVYRLKTEVQASHLVQLYYSDRLFPAAQVNPCISGISRSQATTFSHGALLSPCPPTKPSTRTLLKDLPPDVQTTIRLWVVDKVVPDIPAGIARWEAQQAKKLPADDHRALIMSLSNAAFLSMTAEEHAEVARRAENTFEDRVRAHLLATECGQVEPPPVKRKHVPTVHDLTPSEVEQVDIIAEVYDITHDQAVKLLYYKTRNKKKYEKRLAAYEAALRDRSTAALPQLDTPQSKYRRRGRVTTSGVPAAANVHMSQNADDGENVADNEQLNESDGDGDGDDDYDDEDAAFDDDYEEEGDYEEEEEEEDDADEGEVEDDEEPDADKPDGDNVDEASLRQVAAPIRVSNKVADGSASTSAAKSGSKLVALEARLKEKARVAKACKETQEEVQKPKGHKKRKRATLPAVGCAGTA